MDAQTSPVWLRHLEEIEDPRMDRTRRHELSDILALTLLAVLCGAEHITYVEQFGHDKFDWLKTFLKLPNGIPSHDTIGRVLGLLEPAQLERCIGQWTQDLADASGGRLIAIDGKTLRGSFDRANSRAPIHMVSAFCRDNRLVLGQLATDEKSNEITAIPQLLELLDLSDKVVSIDAMGCQKAIARKIVDGGGDYLLQLKANQGHDHQRIKADLDEQILWRFRHIDHDHARCVDGDHGRVETREIWCTQDLDWFDGRRRWQGLQSVAVIERTRWVDGQKSVERRYYLTSLPADARLLLDLVRGHWSIENQLHWSLDVSYREDDSRVRQGHAAENLSRIRRLTLNLLRQENSVKAGIQAKRLKCGWNHDYLLKVLAAGAGGSD